MIDLCPRCRIQAPHKPGRSQCPRCGGPLSVIDNAAGSAGPAPHPGQPPRVGHTRPANAPRMYRSPHVRWVARRPPETFPPPRPAHRQGPALIPRYGYLPTWGLHDRPVTGAQDAAADARRGGLDATLHVTAIALVVTAVVHLLRYVLLVINRTTPIPTWLDIASVVLVWAAGLTAVVFFATATVSVVGWLRGARAAAYRRHDRLDPRPRWQLTVFAAIPLVNLAGAPVLVRELIAQRDDIDQRRAHLVSGRTAIAWTIVNLAAVAALVTRFIAGRSDSLQTGADGLWLTIVSAALSAAFVWWVLPRLIRVFDDTPYIDAPTRRWVQVAQQ